MPDDVFHCCFCGSDLCPDCAPQHLSPAGGYAILCSHQANAPKTKYAPHALIKATPIMIIHFSSLAGHGTEHAMNHHVSL